MRLQPFTAPPIYNLLSLKAKGLKKSPGSKVREPGDSAIQASADDPFSPEILRLRLRHASLKQPEIRSAQVEIIYYNKKRKSIVFFRRVRDAIS